MESLHSRKNEGVTDPEALDGFYFLVGRRQPAGHGFVWRVWARSTSFYVKPRSSLVGGFKVSVHGPDPRPNLTPGFKLDRDRAASVPAYEVATEGFLPCWFPGHAMDFGLTHVLRIAVPADTFREGAKFGPAAGNVPRGMAGRLLEPPRDGEFACLDLYICDEFPDWPAKAQLEEADAIVGQVQNEAGQYLFGVAKHLSIDNHPLPVGLLEHDAKVGESELTRGVAATIDPRGFAWISERLMSEPKLRSSRTSHESSQGQGSGAKRMSPEHQLPHLRRATARAADL